MAWSCLSLNRVRPIQGNADLSEAKYESPEAVSFGLDSSIVASERNETVTKPSFDQCN